MSTSATVLRNRLLARARLRHLQVLVQVAELGSVRKAAEVIGLTQPAATHLIGELERLLECALFQRHARGMRPTATGHALLPVARGVLGAMAHGAEQVSAMNSHASGVVRVAAIGGAISGLLVRAVPQFGQRHPDILVQLLETDPLSLGALVARDEVDLALCRAPHVLPQGWFFTSLMGDRFVVVARPSHPLVRRRRLSLDELAEQTWMALPTTMAARDAFDALFAGRARPALRQISARSPAMLWALLASEPLLAIIPASVARQFVDAGLLCQLRFDPQLPFGDLGMLQPEAGLGDAAAALAGFLAAFASAPADQT
jgi:DNA-binding transcriptional LysR family regulator